MHPKKRFYFLRAFTLVELLISIGVISLVSSIVIVAINPQKQLINAQDSVRLHSVKQLQDAFQQYAIDHQGLFPNDSQIPDASLGSVAICRQGIVDLTCVNMDAIIPVYLVTIPVDNYQPCAPDSGYSVAKFGSIIQVSAENAGSAYPYTPCDAYVAPPINLLSGLLGYWHLDELSGTSATDSSGNGNTGTYTGSPVHSATVAPLLFTDPASVQLNGSSNYVNLGTGILDGLTAFTVSAWVKPNVVTGSTYGIVSQWDNSANKQAIMMHINNGVLECFVRLTKGGMLGGTFTVSSIPAGSWSHVLVTYTGTKLIAFVNGHLSPASFSVNGSIRSVTSTLSIGGQNRISGDGYFDGYIDDVRIYNRGLTSGEVASLVAGN